MRAAPALMMLIALMASTTAISAEPSSTKFDGIWKGAMVCGDPGKDVAFSAARRAVVKNGRIHLRRGHPERNRFEAWEGIIDATGVVMIFGRYFWKTQKPLWFKGQVDGRKLVAVGQRGPKICELNLTRMSGKTKRKAS